ncbi:hypothetical protein [Pseudooceanicola sp. MF1-13]|uniref:hypothetical protein n=1 Tax=Pseudooceanicola sp. MF1-13 TaxID=3379095 RepID=UPI00389236B0
MTLTDTIVLGALALTALVLFWPRLSRAPMWRAAVTPLASIIGSGFLVLGPILTVSYGIWAPAVMLALCAAAYWLGGAVRFNIRRLAAAKDAPRTRTEDRLDLLSDWALSFAYVISVAYYLNLFGAFALDMTPFASDLNEHLLTTVVFIVILATGWLRGFGALERMEQIAVTVKLAVIGGLLAGMAVHFADVAGAGALQASAPTQTGWAALTLAFGLIVTVQGFETSRYLGDEYDPALRIRSMRLAQTIATAIYLTYIALLSYVFPADAIPLSETGIITMMRQVAPILPALLVAAALTAQFSAAVADTGGAGGLFSDMTGARTSPRMGYAILTVVGVGLTWAVDIYAIIAYASRAFAAYYAIQAAIAALGARAEGRGHAIWFTLLALMATAMAIFGTPVEGA